MPSGGMKPVDEETARIVAAVADEARAQGLLIEWFMYFIGGVKGGHDPVVAAQAAAIEWDF